MKNRFYRSLPCYVTSLSLLAALCLWLAYKLLGAMTTLCASDPLTLQGLRLFFVITWTLAILLAAITGRFFWVWGALIRKQKLLEKTEELDRLKNDFLIVASHELKSPLTALREGMALLMDEPAGNLTDIQHSLMAIIERNTKRLCHLVNDILDISMLEAGRMFFKKDRVVVKPLLMGAVDAVGLSATAKNISMNILMNDELPPVFGDALRLHQVLVQLLSNSINNTPNGGRIDLSAVVTSSTNGNDHEVIQFCAADTGVGISQEAQKRLFEKFQRHETNQEPPKGAGLGLRICKEMVTAHQGTMWIESHPGAGTRVFFTVPQFNPQLWWPEVWQQLQMDGTESGVVVVGIQVEPPDKSWVAGFEARISSCIKKQDRILCETESGLIWVVAAAKRLEGKRIAERIANVLQAYLDESCLSDQTQFRITWDHAPNMLLDPMALVAQSRRLLREQTREKNLQNKRG